MITANIIADSANPDGIRLTTFVVKYPRFIHSELMTHRVLSRNAASSRAIPIEKMIQAIRDEIAEPEQWGSNQKGMQAGPILDTTHTMHARLAWTKAAEYAIAYVERLDFLGVHKQIANRLLEPFSHITVVATASSWTNFFALRAHPMAQPEFQVLAYRMLDAYLKSIPENLKWDQWHLPFIQVEDRDLRDVVLTEKEKYSGELLAKVSAARCARVSYLTHEGKRDILKDLELYARLAGSTPLHASALEHPARATQYEDGDDYPTPSNFHSSWQQLRKFQLNENVTVLDLSATLAAKPDWITL